MADMTLFFELRHRASGGTDSHQELCMNPNFVKRRALAVVALSVAGLLVACGEDKRVKNLNAGITIDSAMAVIGKDAKGSVARDSFPNVYTRERYLIEGKNYEVLYFTPENQKFTPGDSVQLRKLTPIVFIDNTLIGKGWPAWDSIAAAHKIVVAPPLKK
jgi:hypothetical protein